METQHTKLIVALDVPSATEALDLFWRLRGIVHWFKIGSQLFTAAGAEVVRAITKADGKVFLDLKFHDIPNTAAAAGREAVRLGVSMFNVHASGGSIMMQRTMEAVSDEAARLGASRPSVIAVTVLTSHDQTSLNEIGVDSRPSLEAHALQLARLAQAAKLDGVVASVHETQAIKRTCGAGFLVVTPGVRPANTAHDDQRRVATPASAALAGADFIVVGRAILDHAEPAQAVGIINDELREAHRAATNKAEAQL